MVLHAAEARVLRVPAGAGWTLPHCTPAVTDFRRRRHSTEQRRAQYGLESVVPRCVAPRDDPVNAASSRVYVRKNRRTTTPLPRGGPWDSAAELAHVPLPMPAHRALMRRWLPASPAAPVSALQAPWLRQGWFDDAAAWIQAQWAQQPLQVLGPLVQARVWALSCVMRAWRRGSARCIARPGRLSCPRNRARCQRCHGSIPTCSPRPAPSIRDAAGGYCPIVAGTPCCASPTSAVGKRCCGGGPTCTWHRHARWRSGGRGVCQPGVCRG